MKQAFFVPQDSDIAKLFPKRRADLHKGDCGSAAILMGEASEGASLLAALACLKSGAGYTKLYVDGDVRPYAARYPACMVRRRDEADELLSDAIAWGMGAGSTVETYERTRSILKNFRGTAVLDADALNSLARFGKEPLVDRVCGVVLTPHPKEFSRLTGKSVEEILRDPAPLATAFAREYGAVVVLKSHRTVIADGVRTAVNPTGCPALAKGGSGDALAGFLAGTLARGLPPFEAAVASCYILGRAGEIAARDMGEYSPDATDVIARFGRAIVSLRTDLSGHA